MFLKGIIVIIGLLISSSAISAQQITAGVDYIELKTPVKTSNPDKVVVTEIFWYGCPHCFNLDPIIHKWKQTASDGVVLELEPSVIYPGWLEHARVYFALEMMGEVDKVHKPLFNAIHKQKKRLNIVDSLAEFVSKLGIDEKQFRDYYQSFQVDMKIRKGKLKEAEYGHKSVPTLIVNGKYRIVTEQAKSNQRLIEVLDFLVKKELPVKNIGVIKNWVITN